MTSFEKFDDDSSNQPGQDEYDSEANTPGYTPVIPIRVIDGTEGRKKIIKNLKVLLGFVLANFFYLISDQKCPWDDPTICANQFIFPHVTRWALQVFISALFFVFIIYKGVRQHISPYYVLAALVNIIYLCFFYHPIINAREYGQMFGAFLFLCVILILSTLGIGFLIRHIYRRKPKALFLIPAFLLLFGVVFYYTKVNNSCVNWTHGLDGEKIEKVAGTCNVRLPPVCAYEITDGWFDLSRFSTCSSFKARKSIIEKNYPDSPVIGFPRTEFFAQADRVVIQNAVLERTIPLGNMKDPAAKDLEVFITNAQEKHPEIKIDVKRNQTLVDERAKIPHKGLSKNVIVIYIDALSRVNSLRKLKKTMGWFDEQMNKKDPDFEAFQFFKYHAVTPFTTNNLDEALFGIPPTDKNHSAEQPVEEFIKHFRDNGYITGHATDFCKISPLDIVPDWGFKEIPYDHEGISFACDPHYHDPDSPYGLLTGPYSSVRRCLYGKDVFEYVYEYGNQFWRKYKNEKKILYLDFLDAHEGTGEVVKYMDGALHGFLDTLKKDKLLEDTVVLFYADHGLHMQGLFYLMQLSQVFIEISFPSLYLVLPKNIATKHRDNIKENSQKMVVSHDIYDFFLTLAEGPSSPNLKTSLIGPISPSRTCDELLVWEGTCMCDYEL